MFGMIFVHDQIILAGVVILLIVAGCVYDLVRQYQKPRG